MTRHFLISKNSVSEREFSGWTDFWYIIELIDISVPFETDSRVKISFQTKIIPDQYKSEITYKSIVENYNNGIVIKDSYKDAVFDISDISLPKSFGSEKNPNVIQDALNKFYLESYFKNNAVYEIQEWETLKFDNYE